MTTVVKLSCKVLNIKQKEFSVEHANAILNYEGEKKLNNWYLDDKNFVYTNGRIEPKQDKTTDT